MGIIFYCYSVMSTAASFKLPKDVSSILLVKSLPYKITSAELYQLFGQYGAIIQIRLGNTNTTRGRAYVVYDNQVDAMNACTHLNGYAVHGRYIVVLYYQPDKSNKTSNNNTSDIDNIRHKREQEQQHVNTMKTKLAV